MNRQVAKFLNVLVSLLIALAPLQTIHAAAPYCYCEPNHASTRQQASDNLNENNTGGTPNAEARCVLNQNQGNCTDLNTNSITCSPRNNESECNNSVTDWNNRLAVTQSTVSVVGIVIPSCLLEPVIPPQCRDVNILVILLINFARWAFSVIGAVALAVFVWGGFTLILSQGNTEKVQQGWGILTAAVMGLFVAFMGYILVKFVGDALGVKELYRLQ